jgi:hypothetical protein
LTNVLAARREEAIVEHIPLYVFLVSFFAAAAIWVWAWTGGGFTFSGSAARAMLIETMQTQGVDSFPALVAATIQGSTETTFYVLAVYFGSVGIQRARHAVGCALLAEFAGVVAAIAVCYWFFG